MSKALTIQLRMIRQIQDSDDGAETHEDKTLHDDREQDPIPVECMYINY
jgi:hypothetical protein